MGFHTCFIMHMDLFLCVPQFVFAVSPPPFCHTGSIMHLSKGTSQIFKFSLYVRGCLSFGYAIHSQIAWMCIYIVLNCFWGQAWWATPWSATGGGGGGTKGYALDHGDTVHDKSRSGWQEGPGVKSPKRFPKPPHPHPHPHPHPLRLKQYSRASWTRILQTSNTMLQTSCWKPSYYIRERLQ